MVIGSKLWILQLHGYISRYVDNAGTQACLTVAVCDATLLR